MECTEGVSERGTDFARTLSGASETKLRVRVSGEHFDGPPEFRILVDGRQEGGLFTVTADFRKGEWQEIVLTVPRGRGGPKSVEIEYLNDYSGGSWQTDRNLLVDYLEVDGFRFAADEADYDRHWQETIRGQQRMAWGGRLVFHPRRGYQPIAWADRSSRKLAEALNRGPSSLVPDWIQRPAVPTSTSG